MIIKRSLPGLGIEVSIELTWNEQTEVYNAMRHIHDIDDINALYGGIFNQFELDAIAGYKRNLEFENHLGWVDAVNTAINRLGWLNRIREIISDEDLARIT